MLQGEMGWKRSECFQRLEGVHIYLEVLQRVSAVLRGQHACATWRAYALSRSSRVFLLPLSLALLRDAVQVAWRYEVITYEVITC
jgi:hypothetical protein